MLKLHTRQINTTDTTTMKRAKKQKNKSGDKTELRTTKCLRNQGRTKGEGWSTANYLKPPPLPPPPPPPVIFIAGRPKAALLFWFFGDFRCGAVLFMVIHVIYKYKNR